MIIGEEQVTATEEALASLRLHVVTSRRRAMETWSFQLFSPFWRLYANDRSGAAIRVSGRRLPIRPNRLYLIPAWVAFETELERPVVHDYLHFYLSGFPMSLHARLFAAPFELAQDSVLTPLLVRWRAGLAAGASGDWVAYGWATALAQAALCSAARQIPPETAESCSRWMSTANEVRPALTAIEENLATPPTNEYLANLCSVSTNHFIRLFRDSVGLTPARYGLERRLAVASGMLVDTPRSIDAIAAATGFTDRFHFSRCFKTRFGFSPGRYRRLHLHRL